MTCPGCLKFRSGNHPDFLRIRPDGAAIKIDQIRELKKSLNYAPFESAQRVVILEEVHTMRREAGNSLLKVLEEPPPDNLLILDITRERTCRKTNPPREAAGPMIEIG